MTAGLILLSSIWKYTFPADDSVGGAVPSGTILYSRIETRIAPIEPTMALLEQGLETPTLFTAIVRPGTLQIEQNYEVEITAPIISQYYGQHFRILGVQNTSVYADDPRGFILLTLRRSERAHGIQ
jgi:hypothetical protein